MKFVLAGQNKLTSSLENSFFNLAPKNPDDPKIVIFKSFFNPQAQLI